MNRRLIKPWIAFLYLIPVFAIIGLFRFYPIIFSIRASFFKWGMGGPIDFSGLENYLNIFKDRYFWQAFSNTVWYAVFTVPLSLFVSLLAAVLLNNKLRGIGLFRTIYFLPVVTSIVAISMVWKWIYHPEVGLANHILTLLQLPGLEWLSEWRGIFELLLGRDLPLFLQGPSLALFSIILMTVWKGLGYNIVIFLAGLQNIPESYYEAAEIDGAGGFTIFKNVTWPLISPTTFYVLIMTTIISFKVFAPVWLMTGPPAGGPLGSTNVLVYYLFDNAFNYARYGYGSAISMFLFLVILTLTLIQRKVIEPRVHYG